MQDGRAHLIRQFKQAQQQVARLREMVEAKEKKVQELEKKVSLVTETQELLAKARAEMPEIDRSVQALERTAAKIEALAAAENSRNNSTREVRVINQKIEKALDDVHRAERKASQCQMDCNAIEHDLEKWRSEFDDEKKTKARSLDGVNHEIQEIRQGISKARKANLDMLLEKQEKLANTEIENQNLTTHVLLYRQLVASIKAELEALKAEKGIDTLNSENTKVSLVLKDIPVHTENPGQNTAQASEKCKKLRNDIHGMEDEIRNSIGEMSKAESDQDRYNHEIQEAEGKNADLRSALSSGEALKHELRRELDLLIKKEATNAQDEAKMLQRDINTFQDRIDKAKKKQADLTGDDDVSAARPPMLEQIIDKIESEQREITRRIRELDDEIQNLSQ